MSKLEKPLISRRTLMQGAASLTGASALGLLPTQALAAGLQGSVGNIAPVPSLYYWNNGVFVLAAQLPSGDPNLRQVQMTVESFGSSPYSSIDSSVTVEGQTLPFYAWTAPPSGLKRTTFLQSVASAETGVALTTHQPFGASTITTPIRLTAGTAAAPKLLAGVYVLTSGPVNLSLYTYNDSWTNSPLGIVGDTVIPAPFPFIVITVSAR